jgi:hypothetical protein
MMDKTARITISIPGNNRHIDASVVLGDLARKLRGVDLAAGQHEIILFGDGSVALDLSMQWEPAQLAPVVDNRRKTG